MANELSRNKQHEKIMTCIYDALLYMNEQDEFSLEEVMSLIYEMPFDEIPLFSREIVIKSLSHYNEIEEVFQSHMPKWKFNRLDMVERAILLMSYTHVKLTDEHTDKKVVISVAVNLAKLYLGQDDYKFVNAILDNVL